VRALGISGKTKICGVIGDPISHSLSPTIQNSAFSHLNLDVIYLAFNIKTEELKNFSGNASIEKQLRDHHLTLTDEYLSYKDMFEETL
jgi:shikimate 5-dehydrogenase